MISGKSKVKRQRFKVLVHTVRTKRNENANYKKALAAPQAHNPKLKVKVKFLKLT